MAEKQQTTQAEVDAHIEKRKKENIIWSSVTALLCLAIFGNIILAGITFGITYGLNKRNDEKELAQIQRDWDITP